MSNNGFGREMLKKMGWDESSYVDEPEVGVSFRPDGLALGAKVEREVYISKGSHYGSKGVIVDEESNTIEDICVKFDTGEIIRCSLDMLSGKEPPAKPKRAKKSPWIVVGLLVKVASKKLPHLIGSIGTIVEVIDGKKCRLKLINGEYSEIISQKMLQTVVNADEDPVIHLKSGRKAKIISRTTNGKCIIMIIDDEKILEDVSLDDICSFDEFILLQ